ncbi:YmfQ family protein [Stutzerimonas kirkiae]|uniref:YmfQ family protein n=1 Tax=Stutzerimonas kirkiae TaxID=2211392 RepID=UPI0010385A8B|nr:putative phage tail protein [Stutzerimonas kirkiae]TBV12746.1 phage tail protein [Stutzerimonas kirkiae]
MSTVADQLCALLPPDAYDGAAQLLSALNRADASSLEAANRAGDQVLDRVWPDNAAALGDWERVLGLPDPCVVGDDLTVRQRVAAVIAKLRGVGGQSRAFFIQLAASLGYEVTITEFRPPRVGMVRAGDPVAGEGWTSAWRVNAPAVTVFRAVAGTAAAGEALSVWGNKSLECRLSAMQPAHATLIFGYGGN